MFFFIDLENKYEINNIDNDQYIWQQLGIPNYRY